MLELDPTKLEKVDDQQDETEGQHEAHDQRQGKPSQSHLVLTSQRAIHCCNDERDRRIEKSLMLAEHVLTATAAAPIGNNYIIIIICSPGHVRPKRYRRVRRRKQVTGTSCSASSFPARYVTILNYRTRWLTTSTPANVMQYK